MSTNWKKYQDDPKYLIALLPGLEIARDNVEEEIASIRAAISGGAPPPAPQGLVPAGRPRKKRKYVRRAQKLLEAAKPGFDSDGMTQSQFIAAVCAMHGGKATNEQLRNEASLHAKFANLAIPQRLSVAVAGAIHTHKTVKRVAPGILKAL